jgi:hypothetical protein
MAPSFDSGVSPLPAPTPSHPHSLSPPTDARDGHSRAVPRRGLRLVANANPEVAARAQPRALLSRRPSTANAISLPLRRRKRRRSRSEAFCRLFRRKLTLFCLSGDFSVERQVRTEHESRPERPRFANLPPERPVVSPFGRNFGVTWTLPPDNGRRIKYFELKYYRVSVLSPDCRLRRRLRRLHSLSLRRCCRRTTTTRSPLTSRRPPSR